MTEGQAGGKRTRELAVVVPILGTVLLMPPLVGLFARGSVAGVPLIVAYLFGLWLALILAAALLARRLGGETGPGGA